MAAKRKTPKRSKKPKTDFPKIRETLFRPERRDYVRKIDRPKECVFCAAVADRAPRLPGKATPDQNLLLFRGEHAMVILNKYPYNSGHVLVLPVRHIGEFTELTPDEHREIAECISRAIAAIREVYRPAGFNCGLNLGSAAGAGIPEHLHHHVIPRWAGDTNFFPLIAQTKVVIETLEQTHARLLPYFS